MAIHRFVPTDRPYRNTTISRTILVLLAFLIGVASAATAIADPTAIGPGVAGQIHALAYDPDNLGTIYAGGDNSGVFVSYNHGENWQSINDGLQTPDFVKSFYVDDLLVLGNAAPASVRGVWAATHAGIFFRPGGDGPWLPMTPSTNSTYSYTGAGTYAGVRGAPIPFACLAWDATNQVLYAGAGHARAPGEWNDVTNEWDPWPGDTIGGNCTTESCASRIPASGAGAAIR